MGKKGGAKKPPAAPPVTGPTTQSAMFDRKLYLVCRLYSALSEADSLQMVASIDAAVSLDMLGLSPEQQQQVRDRVWLVHNTLLVSQYLHVYRM